MQNDLTGGGMGSPTGPAPAQDPSAPPGGQIDPGALEQPGGNLAAPSPAATPPVGLGTPGKGIPSIDQFKEMHKKESLIDLKLQKLLKQSGPISRRDIIDMSVSIVKDRLMSSAQMAGLLNDLPEDPQALREWVQRHAMQVEQTIDLMAGLMHGSEQMRPLGDPEPPPPKPQPGEAGDGNEADQAPDASAAPDDSMPAQGPPIGSDVISQPGPGNQLTQ